MGIKVNCAEYSELLLRDRFLRCEMAKKGKKERKKDGDGINYTKNKI